jgi:hypothetical protein
MSDRISIILTSDELEALNIILTHTQEMKTEEIDKDVQAFIENLLIKIAKAKFEENVINQIPKSDI